jgi:hypothetical protein
MLCESCEGNLSKLETKCIVSLRKTAREIESRAEHGALLHTFDFEILSRFLLSVLWRAAISKQEPFAQIFIDPDVQEEIRLSLLEPPGPITKFTHCQVLKIRDASRRISAARWEGVAVSPVAAVHGKTIVYTFIFAGYLVKYFIPYVPAKWRAQPGFVRQSGHLFIPTIDMRKIPELMHLLAAGYGKAHAGRVAF